MFYNRDFIKGGRGSPKICYLMKDGFPNIKICKHQRLSRSRETSYTRRLPGRGILGPTCQWPGQGCGSLDRYWREERPNFSQRNPQPSLDEERRNSGIGNPLGSRITDPRSCKTMRIYGPYKWRVRANITIHVSQQGCPRWTKMPRWPAK